MSNTTSAPTVGTRFTKTDSRGWRDESNTRHRHTYTLECRVTATGKTGLTWELLAVLNETDRPETGAFLPEQGEIAWFGWEAARDRGDVAVITAA